MGVILETVSGQSYEDLLREQIFGPLGMNDLGYDSTRPLLDERAAWYDKRIDGSYVNTGYLDMTLPYAAGALYSTVSDLYRWDRALYTDSIVNTRSKELMFTPGLSDYGYGWSITTDDAGTQIEHGGGINGFNTLITRNPDSNRVIILLNNTGGAPLGQMAELIRAILDGKEPTMPKKPAAAILLETYEASGLSATLAQVNRMRAGSEYDAGDGELSRLVGRLLELGEAADGLQIAQRLSEDSPTSAAAAVLVARSHRANGHRIEAVQNYARAIELSETPRAFLIYTDAIRALSTLQPATEK